MTETNYLEGVSSLCIDSKEIARTGSLYICLTENRERQQQYIEAAQKKGAHRILAKALDGRAHEQQRTTFLEHDTFQRTIADISQKFFKLPTRQMHLFGVTGTNGKTTTSWFMYHMLQKNYSSGLIGTLGVFMGDTKIKTPWTTPESPVLASLFRQMVDQRVTHAAMEVSSIAVEEHRIQGCFFDGLVFTNLTQDHLDYHGTMEKYYLAKKKFFENHAAPHANHILFTGDAHGEELHKILKKSNTPTKVYSVDFAKRKDPLHTTIHMERESPAGTEFSLETPWGLKKVKVEFIADFNVLNYTLAAVCLLSQGISVNLEDYPLPSGRLEKIKLPNGAYAFVDYAHTPDALDKVCRVLSRIKEKGKLHVLFGCGGDRDKTKRPQMGRSAAEHADSIILTTDNSRSEDPLAIMKQIREGIPSSFSVKHVTMEVDRRRAILDACRHLKAGDILCVAGKGHEQTQTDQKGTHPFSDQQVLKEFKNV